MDSFDKNEHCVSSANDDSDPDTSGRNPVCSVRNTDDALIKDILFFLHKRLTDNNRAIVKNKSDLEHKVTNLKLNNNQTSIDSFFKQD